MYTDSNGKDRIILTSMLKMLLLLEKKSIALIEENTCTKCVSFYVLHTCVKYQQPRCNKKKVTLQVLICN